MPLLLRHRDCPYWKRASLQYARPSQDPVKPYRNWTVTAYQYGSRRGYRDLYEIKRQKRTAGQTSETVIKDQSEKMGVNRLHPWCIWDQGCESFSHACQSHAISVDVIFLCRIILNPLLLDLRLMGYINIGEDFG